MYESVQLAMVVCLTIIMLAGLFLAMVWIAAKNKNNQK